jgi:hypothetical protein
VSSDRSRNNDHPTTSGRWTVGKNIPQTILSGDNSTAPH